MPEVSRKRGVSAAHTGNKSAGSSADLLEPWSVRGITSLNIILRRDRSYQGESF